jgi:hypothetical protein
MKCQKVVAKICWKRREGKVAGKTETSTFKVSLLESNSLLEIEFQLSAKNI